MTKSVLKFDKHQTAGWRTLAPIAAAAWLLVGCGGGAGESVTTGGAVVETTAGPVAAPPDTAVAAIALSGVAATGAPMASANVKVYDQTASQVCETTTLDDGSYRCTLDVGAKAPLTIVASLGEQSLYSSAATVESGTVNITPLTNLIVSRLSPSGDPSRLVNEIKADPGLVDKVKLDARVEEVRALLKPLMDAVGDSANPISGVFTANGAGHDKVLDALQINIRPDAQGSNIDITVKVKPADDGSAPMLLSFKSSDLKPAPLTVAIDKNQLAGDGVAAKLAGFFARSTDCYAQPLAQRVAKVAAGALTAVGGPGDVMSTECRELFLDDDPATYKNNGLRVGSSGDFFGLFREDVTGVKFDLANFEYQQANGDLFVTFRSTVTTGARNLHTLFLREQGGKLKAVGNQFAYRASVRAFASNGEFPLQQQYDWLGTGFKVSIDNRIDAATRLPVFKEANVIAPNGAVTLYRPNGGQGSMGVVADGAPKSATGQFLASSWKAPTTAGKPSDKGFNYWVKPQLSDDEIRALPDQGVWTIEFVHADPAAANVVQKYRTISRAPTLGEVRMAKYAQLTEAFRQQLSTNTAIAAAAGIVFGAPSAANPNVADLSAEGGQDAWYVPDGASSPTSITIFGNNKGVSFSDGVTVRANDRRVVITCVPLSSQDLSCDESTSKLQYAEGSKINYMSLWALSHRQVEFIVEVGLYKLN